MKPELSTPPALPTTESERIHAFDAIRGVAIMGVLFAETVWSLGGPDSAQWTAFDNGVAKWMDYFVDNKFLTLFACMFGVGIAQQWRRWETSGANISVLHARRMGFMILVGLIHAVTVRNGDILAPYAIMGFLMLPWRKTPVRVLAPLAIVLFFLPYAVGWGMDAFSLNWPERPTNVTGGYFYENLAWLKHWYVTNPLTSWPRIFALVLTGVVLVRSGVVERLIRDRKLAVRSLSVALILAVVTRVVLDKVGASWSELELSRLQSSFLNFMYQLSSFSLAATYASLLFLVCHSPKAVERLKPLRSVGRMAFTNYLSQAFIAVPVCLAFGLFDQISPGRGLLFGLLIGVAQFLFSSFWLKRHTMGPLERLWRNATYGRSVPA